MFFKSILNSLKIKSTNKFLMLKTKFSTQSHTQTQTQTISIRSEINDIYKLTLLNTCLISIGMILNGMSNLNEKEIKSITTSNKFNI
jgi:hypothetical protein